LFWVIPLVAALLVFWKMEAVGTVWWYVVIPALTAMVLLDLFASTWFGITILAVLFVYSSIGSSGVPIQLAIWEPQAWVNLREMRALEMTEFEWFHWWPFKWLIALLCYNMSISTIRRIPLNILSVGAWGTHVGIIVLVLGCMVYFSMKIEGDVLISRCRVVVEDPNGDPVSMVVTPANSMSVGDTTYTISNIDPNWELLSGDDAGQRVYAVSVSVQNPSDTFTRQLIYGYPQYTEDIIRTDDPEQPMARAKNVLGRALLDESLVMRLEDDAKDQFLVTQSGAIYLRELSEFGVPLTPWIERPIENLPRFNDYVAAYDDVWVQDGGVRELHPLDLHVPPSRNNDPVKRDMVVTSYLRYAFMSSQIIAGGNEMFPVAWVTLRKGTIEEQSVELHAFDPSSSTANTTLLTFRWVNTAQELESLSQSLSPSITATIDGVQHDLVMTNSEEFTTIDETEYAFRVKAIQNNLNIGGTLVSLAQIEIQHGDQTWERWVFDNPELNRDVVEGDQHGDAKFVDSNIAMTYAPGAAPITLVGGPENDSLSLLTSITGGDPASVPITVGTPVTLTDDVTLTIDRLELFSRSIERPTIIPRVNRDPNALNSFSMVKITIPINQDSVSVWLPYHHFPFESQTEAIRRFRYNPTTLRLPDGRSIELLYSRRRELLPVPVALERFEIDSHIGGFSGKTPSILNWRSVVRFLDGTQTTTAVSVNDPQRYGDYWFFQSQWDPPTSASSGLNYTVLGVGNRHGVFTMLLGCCLAVAGMIWSFYIKPVIKRKRQQLADERVNA